MQKIKQVLISESDIKARVKEIAKKISADYAGKTVTFEVNGKTLSGSAAGVNEKLEYLINCEGETFALSAGEVNILDFS